jgi:hypothetical protein
MVMIWGLQSKGAKRGNPKQSDLRELQIRAVILLDMLEADGKQIIVPTVMVAELLVGVDRKNHGEFVAKLQERFFCPPFDLRASALAAELWQFHKDLPKSNQLQRNVLKADVMIIATAKAAGASAFYSHDAACRRLAEHVGMVAQDLPVNHPDMFRDEEIKKQFR